MSKNKNKTKKTRGVANLERLTLALMKKANIGSKKKKKNKQGRITRSSMGPVAAISTAPVAIGNSVRGAKSQMRRIGNDCISVIGRDFMFTPISTGSVTTWTLCGGVPLTPVVFADSCISNYMRMYGKFKWKRLVVHYITSSPTTATGDVMFYYSKNRDSVFLNQTSSMLLPFVMTDPNAIIGPQWTNHSMDIQKSQSWKSTDYGMDECLNEYADGDLFLLSKTNTTDSPGYVLFDYEIEFCEQQLNPRLLNLPIPRASWWQMNVGASALAVTGGTTLFLGDAIGNALSGSASAFPGGSVYGDIYKVVLDITNSVPGSWTNANAADLVQIKTGGNAAAQVATLSDGFTLYGVYDGTALRFFSTCSSAYSGNQTVYFNPTATVTFNLQMWISFVGSVVALGNTPNF